MCAKLKIYIIGNIEDFNCIKTIRKFRQLEKKLSKECFDVVNPLKIYTTNNLISKLEATPLNLIELITANAVYIMPEVSFNKGYNIEVKLSLYLNLIVIHGMN